MGARCRGEVCTSSYMTSYINFGHTGTLFGLNPNIEDICSYKFLLMMITPRTEDIHKFP